MTPLAHFDPPWLQTRAVLRAVAVVLAVAVLLWLSFTLRRMLLLLALTVFFSYLLAPLVELFQRPRRRIGTPWLARPFAVGAAYLLVFGTLALGISSLLPGLGRQITQLGEAAPSLIATLNAGVEALLTGPRSWPLPTRLRGGLDHLMSQAGPTALGWLAAAMMQLAGYLRYLPWLVLVPVVAFFLLTDAPDLRSWFLQGLPEGRFRWRGRDLFDEINRVLASFVRAQLISCLFVAVAATVGLAALAVPYALILGLLGGVLEFIPMLGSTMFVIIACSVAATAGRFVPAGVFLLLLRVTQDYVLYPRLIGRGLRMRPIAIILALICGSQLGGVAGLFFAIPLVAIGSVVYRHLGAQLRADGLLGAIFGSPQHVSVPALMATPSSRSRQTDPMPAGVRILIVDNDEDSRESIAIALRDEKLEVLTAASTSEAIEILRREHPDILISDIGMPGEDGLDLIRRVRALPIDEGSAIRAAALTGYTTPEDEERILLAGFELHLKKPTTCETLLRGIAVLLNRPALG